MRAWKENQKNDDFDKDGLSNFEEYSIGTFPDKLDSDNDGIPDEWEYLKGLNALSSNSSSNELQLPAAISLMASELNSLIRVLMP